MLSRHASGDPALYQKRVPYLRQWLDSKVPFTLATDGGAESSELGPVVWGRLGRRHFENMESLVDAGAAPMDVLIGATRRGAEAYGLARDLRTIEPGKIADLLVLNADPLADIRNFRKIGWVIKDGCMVDRASLPTVNVIHYDPEARWPY